MRAPLSVVVPTLNAEKDLPACLAALYEGVAAGILRELIVVDGGSEDETRTLADEAGAKVLQVAASRGGQLRAGGAQVHGDWILFVHADTVLSSDWASVVEAHFGDRSKVGYFALEFADGGRAGRLVAGWANLRSRLFGLPYGDQGLLISRKRYNELGGFDDIPLMEDVALMRKLRRRGLVRLQATAFTSAQKYQTQGWLRRGRRNISTLLRYYLGAAPEQLAETYRRK